MCASAKIKPGIKYIITLIGGAGPDAAIDMQKKLLCAMRDKLDIKYDQDYYRIIVDNNTDLPNRDNALLLNGPSPLLAYVECAKKLEEMGGDILIVSCNTAHVYFDDIQKSTNMKMINMIEETAHFVHRKYGYAKKIGLLSTASTLQKGLYHEAFKKYNIEVISPSLRSQNHVVQAIYGIKAGFISGMRYPDNRSRKKLYNIYKEISQIKSFAEVKLPEKLLKDAVIELVQQGTEFVILGCTEIPLVLNDRDTDVCTLIDPTEITANAAVDYAIGLEKRYMSNKFY